MNKEQDETDVCMLIDTKVFFRYVKIGGQFAKFLEGQYLKKNLMDCIYFFTLLKPLSKLLKIVLF